MAIEKMNLHYSFTNPASVYDEEALTALELAGRQGAKINEVIADQNALRTETETHLASQDADIENQKNNVIPATVKTEVQNQIDNGTFDEQIETYSGNVKSQLEASDRALSARMDSFTSLEGGSTTGDAELQDARVSDNGNTYTNVGDHLRTNFKLMRLHNAPQCVKEQKLYDLFKHCYIAGLENTAKDCISIYPPFKVDRPVHVKPLDGYSISLQEWYDAEGTESRYYHTWCKEKTLKAGVYYSICLNLDSGGEVSLDEGYAIEFKEPFYLGEVYGNVLDVIYPLFAIGGYNLNDSDVYDDSDATAMFTKGGFTLDSPTLIHCKGDASVAFHAFSDNTISHDTKIGDTGWLKELLIPANTFGVIYFRKADDRPECCIDDLKLIGVGRLTSGTVSETMSAFIAPERKGIAHRGYSYYGTYAPENTLPAFRLAKQNGFDYFECDVRITSDGVPVVCHDATVNRTSNGTGNVADMTLEELKALDFSVECDIEKYSGTTLPTLEETLITAKNLGMGVYIEIEPECEGYEATIVNLVRKYSMQNAVAYISFSQAVLSNVTQLDVCACVGLLKDTPDETILSMVEPLKTGYNDVFLDAKDITEELIETCKENDIPVEIWCVDDVTTLQNMNPYVRGVTSEYTNFNAVIFEKEMEGV